MQVELTYFKESGKYYAEGTFNSEKMFLFEIAEEVRAMPKHPGLGSQWKAGPILIITPITEPGLIRMKERP